jgi:hypothetical protein
VKTLVVAKTLVATGSIVFLMAAAAAWQATPPAPLTAEQVEQARKAEERERLRKEYVRKETGFGTVVMAP